MAFYLATFQTKILTTASPVFTACVKPNITIVTRGQVPEAAAACVDAAAAHCLTSHRGNLSYQLLSPSLVPRSTVPPVTAAGESKARAGGVRLII